MKKHLATIGFLFVALVATGCGVLGQLGSAMFTNASLRDLVQDGAAGGVVQPTPEDAESLANSVFSVLLFRPIGKEDEIWRVACVGPEQMDECAKVKDNALVRVAVRPLPGEAVYLLTRLMDTEGRE